MPVSKRPGAGLLATLAYRQGQMRNLKGTREFSQGNKGIFSREQGNKQKCNREHVPPKRPHPLDGSRTSYQSSASHRMLQPTGLICFLII